MPISAAERQELIGYLPVSMRTSEMLDAWIRGAEFRVSRSYFGNAYIYALSRIVAHKAIMDEMASEGVAGPATQKREGDISISYGGSGDTATDELDATVYGKEYKSLLAQYKPNPGITHGICIGGGLDGGDRIQSLF
ncbi:Protein of unknown function [Fibrobacter sp. UWOV1]|uniref:DUF4054 domain-containing protein n=1 Tax=Fibrobacter sp. UWOV1 TaxID=1896215 RepID=UPI00091305BB|nr:DUF4054 domain-containing protein [Fibrobacter sp. UWOV1]SHL42236.1 Protein of unknown function [Fibrobacter sp. UWOV1]